MPVLLLALALSGCAMQPPANDSRALDLTEGDRCAMEVEDQFEWSGDAPASLRVDEAAGSLASARRRQDVEYRFETRAGKGVVAAGACPNGLVFATDTLVNSLSPPELKFALGHEIGHLELRHHATLRGLSPGQRARAQEDLELAADCFGLEASGVGLQAAFSALRNVAAHASMGRPTLEQRLAHLRNCPGD